MHVAQDAGVQHSRVLGATAGIIAAAGIATWLFAAERHGDLPPGSFTRRATRTITLDGPGAAATRRTLISRAAVFLETPLAMPPLPERVTCRFLRTPPTGTSAKFDCVLDGGDLVKVKYSANPEIHAEIAATQLLAALGLPADRMDIVPRLRCYGCPRYPFFTMQLLTLAGADGLLGEHGFDDGYTDFEWVAVERKFPADAVETPAVQGWAWFELAASRAPRAEIDALRLLAVFLAHWDNKSSNQRLVCLQPAGSGCDRPLLMLQDLGATFGPKKVNLEGWRTLPVWQDRRACTVTMKHLPWNGGTFPDAVIAEQGRALLLDRLRRFDEARLRALFTSARFPQFQASTADERDLQAWMAAFRHRVAQIADAGPCPTAAAPTLSRPNDRSG